MELRDELENGESSVRKLRQEMLRERDVAAKTAEFDIRYTCMYTCVWTIYCKFKPCLIRPPNCPFLIEFPLGLPTITGLIRGVTLIISPLFTVQLASSSSTTPARKRTPTSHRKKGRKRIPFTLVEASKGNRCPTPGESHDPP